MKQGRDLKPDWDAFIKNGDASAFYDLYAHYHDYLNYIGFKKGAGAEKVQDGVNDLFLYIYENRVKLSHIHDHHNYLVTSFLRKLFRREHFSVEESLDLTDLHETQVYPSVEAQYIRERTNEQVAAILRNYIDKLSVSQAQMIYQKFYLGLSYEEIAISNQITIKTAYNTVYNAVEKLKKLIGKDQFGVLAAAISLISLLILFIFKNS
ncbi:RNA polymerase sigma factor [Pedobacter sp. GR22-6]|uniref:RNA polymerase sigma factor n=1 Tax=Pedobacter sp. GR22-6 TaxID=3127957 RepID=UPI00307E005F